MQDCHQNGSSQKNFPSRENYLFGHLPYLAGRSCLPWQQAALKVSSIIKHYCNSPYEKRKGSLYIVVDEFLFSQPST